MDHGAVIIRHISSRAAGLRRRSAALLAIPAALLLLLALPALASANTGAATLVDPPAGHHFDYLEVAPMVQFTPGTDADGKQASPLYVIIATDPGMANTIRYCRQFVWATHGGQFNWGCNRWATGAQNGVDQLVPLEEGKVYYWQVHSRPASGGDNVVSEVRSFAIDAKTDKDEQSLDQIRDKVYGTAFDDGTQLNLGARAFVNSGVKVSKINSSRLAPRAYRIHVTHVGKIDASRSYVKVTSKAGTRYLKLAPKGTNRLQAFWRLSAAERRLKSKNFTYQAFLKSSKNGALVRSPVRKVLIRDKKAKTTKTVKPPAWTPDRR